MTAPGSIAYGTPYPLPLMLTLVFGLLASLAGVLALTHLIAGPYLGDAAGCTVVSKERTASFAGVPRLNVDTSCGLFAAGEPWDSTEDQERLHDSLVVGEAYDFEATGGRFWFLIPGITGAVVSR